MTRSPASPRSFSSPFSPLTCSRSSPSARATWPWSSSRPPSNIRRLKRPRPDRTQPLAAPRRPCPPRARNHRGRPGLAAAVPVFSRIRPLHNDALPPCPAFPVPVTSINSSRVSRSPLCPSPPSPPLPLVAAHRRRRSPPPSPSPCARPSTGLGRPGGRQRRAGARPGARSGPATRPTASGACPACGPACPIWRPAQQ